MILSSEEWIWGWRTLPTPPPRPARLPPPSSFWGQGCGTWLAVRIRGDEMAAGRCWLNVTSLHCNFKKDRMEQISQVNLKKNQVRVLTNRKHSEEWAGKCNRKVVAPISVGQQQNGTLLPGHADPMERSGERGPGLGLSHGNADVNEVGSQWSSRDLLCRF